MEVGDRSRWQAEALRIAEEEDAFFAYLQSWEIGAPQCLQQRCCDDVAANPEHPCPAQQQSLPSSGCTVPAHLGDPSKQPVQRFIDNPQEEVEYWVSRILDVSASVDASATWADIPLYSQYIIHTPLAKIVADFGRNLRNQKHLRLTCEQAADLPVQLACSSVLPWAVAAQYGATACGLPTAFVSDLFYTCLSGTLSKHVYVSPWAKSAPDFRIRGKFWACPTGDPNAGKSPVFNFVLDEYVATMRALKDRFPFSRSDFHIYSGGNHGGFNECMRATGGTCLYVGPEFKPMADPKFPSTGATDSRRFVDMLAYWRLLLVESIHGIRQLKPKLCDWQMP
jgi:hypothetical protein